MNEILLVSAQSFSTGCNQLRLLGRSTEMSGTLVGSGVIVDDEHAAERRISAIDRILANIGNKEHHPGCRKAIDGEPYE